MGSSGEVLAKLQEAARKNLGDFMTFEVGPDVAAELARASNARDAVEQRPGRKPVVALARIIEAQLLELGLAGPLEPRQSEYLDHIGTSSSVLLTIVNDILDFSKVEAGKMDLERAELGRAVSTALRALPITVTRLGESSDTSSRPRAATIATSSKRSGATATCSASWSRA